MKFRIVKGTFMPAAGIPDGDTIKFKPKNWKPIHKLERSGFPPKCSKRGGGTISLRYEGIDAPERGAKEPFVCDATAKNIRLLGLHDVYDEKSGYILTRRLGPYGRPIAFVFKGDDAPGEHGECVCLSVEQMQQSVNFQLIKRGAVYPLFYDTLCPKLRKALAEAVVEARNDGRGLWSSDKTIAGVSWGNKRSLHKISPIFPKLWRRLEKYVLENDCERDAHTLETFKKFLSNKQDELCIISESSRHSSLFGIVRVRVQAKKTTFKMNYQPEDIIFKA